MGEPKEVENWGHLKDTVEREVPGNGVETEHLGVSGKRWRMCHVGEREDLGMVRGRENWGCLEGKGVLGAWGNRIRGV